MRNAIKDCTIFSAIYGLQRKIGALFRRFNCRPPSGFSYKNLLLGGGLSS